MSKPHNIKIGKTVEWLLEHIEEFLTINNMDNDGYTFGWYVMRDKSLVTRLRDGGDITTRKLEATLVFMQYLVKYDGKRVPSLKPINIKRSTLP